MTFATSANLGPLDLGEWLSKRSQEELATILENRPDAGVPLPAGFSALATRLTLRSSVTRALASVNAAEIAELEDIAERGGELAPVEVSDVPASRSLKSKALIFGDGKVMVPGAVISALPTGFSVKNQRRVTPEELAQLPPEHKRVLETLQETGLGTTRDAAPDAPPHRPIPQLLAAGLLERVDHTTVRLPRTVRTVLRGQEPVIIPATASGRQGTPVPCQRADEAGAAAGLEVVRLMGQLIEVLGQRPVELLKDKSVGVRQVAALDKQLGTLDAAALIGLGHSARLLSRGEPTGGPEGNFLAPTQASVDWADAPLAARLEALQRAWFHSPWATWESARALDPATRHDFLPRYKDTIVDIYRGSAAALSTEDFLEDLRFSRPLFATHTQPATVENLHAQAQWLGIVAQGRLTHSRPIPEAISHFITQADMTVLAPGPLDTPVLRTLEKLADVESPGLASVYRLSHQSIRRGLDSGLTAAEITTFLSEHNLGELPQGIGFLVADVARGHGALRAGPALSYLRCGDEALLAQAVAVVSELRLLAPTVAVSSVHLGQLLAKLREAGFSPAAEDEQGATITVTPEPALLPTPKVTGARRAEGIDSEQAAAALLTTADAPVPAASQTPLETLRAAARSRHPVVLSYADKEGRTKELGLTPLSVSGGQVDALSNNGTTVRIPVPRIRDVRLA
ncbi:hypothetical protein CPHO_09240 [Corynebacterium phocae]|uniref:Helicase XPB/Ssl2 N-terminal domain-containing protein n=1 Tax=Corynebacterium phocae TaxID=161895 RepID=A0A1L7D4Q4_9CORY|nr:helicase-associated domain-containing protein [Corynebacterium phocae]APT93037.1 hypothetical protein CPHO_09240 [Corynebacterium phocae]KAA8722528.1 hypothetical protein F4V58_08730 [Corynebacterium phocae]